jgi:hypothetical protein
MSKMMLTMSATTIGKDTFKAQDKNHLSIHVIHHEFECLVELWIVGVVDSAATQGAALAQLQQHVHDAYTNRSTARSRTLSVSGSHAGGWM